MTRATVVGTDAGRGGLRVSGEMEISSRADQTWDIAVITRTITGGVATWWVRDTGCGAQDSWASTWFRPEHGRIENQPDSLSRFSDLPISGASSRYRVREIQGGGAHPAPV